MKLAGFEGNLLTWQHQWMSMLLNKVPAFQASLDILCCRTASSTVGVVFEMATEAQMRCAPACTSGRQHTDHLPRVILVSSKSKPCWRRSGLMEPYNISLFKLRSQAARTRRALRRASSRDTEPDSPQTPDSQLMSTDESSSDARRLTAQAAPLAGIVAAISIMLVLPASADAKEALPLDFLTKFLVSKSQFTPFTAHEIAETAAVVLPRILWHDMWSGTCRTRCSS